MSQSKKVLKEFGGVTTVGGSVQILSGSGALGAVSQSKDFVTIKTTGAATLTLAAGKEGQEKKIVMTTDGGDAVLTPSLFAGYVTVTFTAVGQGVHLVFLGGKWNVLSNNGTTLA